MAGRNILVASAYGSGTSVVDLTDPRAPKEIGYYDMRSNQWSTYWYNGLIVANDISRGVDVLRSAGPRRPARDACRCSTRRPRRSCSTDLSGPSGRAGATRRPPAPFVTDRVWLPGWGEDTGAASRHLQVAGTTTRS
ncbi:hypothetical protein [Micromonospora globispora]|uniref:hypothetical protein n=1 Tax=Micromonospora globispora TaxID=1450148 RepID=UPI0014040FF3|nr:hypothetical protein [Micromonospora globispora]